MATLKPSLYVSCQTIAIFCRRGKRFMEMVKTGTLNPQRLFGERGRLDRCRRRPAGGIFRPKSARLLGESASISLMMPDRGW
jgi:hypothetical protein